MLGVESRFASEFVASALTTAPNDIASLSIFAAARLVKRLLNPTERLPDRIRPQGVSLYK